MDKISYPILLLVSLAGIIQLFFGLRLKRKHTDKPIDWKNGLTGGPFYYQLIMNGLACLLGSLFGVLLKFLSQRP